MLFRCLSHISVDSVHTPDDIQSQLCHSLLWWGLIEALLLSTIEIHNSKAAASKSALFSSSEIISKFPHFLGKLRNMWAPPGMSISLWSKCPFIQCPFQVSRGQIVMKSARISVSVQTKSDEMFLYLKLSPGKTKQSTSTCCAGYGCKGWSLSVG